MAKDTKLKKLQGDIESLKNKLSKAKTELANQAKALKMQKALFKQEMDKKINETHQAAAIKAQAVIHKIIAGRDKIAADALAKFDKKNLPKAKPKASASKKVTKKTKKVSASKKRTSKNGATPDSLESTMN